ncbi:VOC family protein [Paenibacillus sp. S150]|uniref:VOC family protein n=1 Tax=Paenibacillus sp. S150 TaxID=2749826 RepID=UPI001C56FF17|nr:VOC family protein [Paenibacillus sp. S150]MBW4081185.1 VOC family protein [Paenibacillus sp. S150]
MRWGTFCREFAGLPPDTAIGHLHLHVKGMRHAERFYCGVMGFAATLHYGPSALFVAPGGYHHHLGLNIWAGPGAPTPPEHAAGLKEYTIVLPGETELEALAARLRTAGVELTAGEDGLRFRDPSEIGVRLVAECAEV